LNRPRCQNCPHCWWFFVCWGGGYNCSECETEEDCSACQCSWESGGGCNGTPTPCEDFTIEEDCVSQDGCTWEED